MANKTLLIPDIGADQAEVIEVLIQPGDALTPETSVMTLEGEKATMEVPAGEEATVTEVRVKVGDTVKPGQPFAEVTLAVSDTPPTSEAVAPAASSQTKQPFYLPDIGADQASVIELIVQPGDQISQDQPLLTLEGEKATMEVPSPAAGELMSWSVSVGQVVKAGDLIAEIQAESASMPSPKSPVSAPEKAPEKAPVQPSAPAVSPQVSAVRQPTDQGTVYAGPATRRFANTFGVDLTRVQGSGPKGRIVPADVHAYIQTQLARIQSGDGLPQAAEPASQAVKSPAVSVDDFSQYGPVTTESLSKIKRYSGKHLTMAWQTIPHVTQYGSANITAIEAARKELKAKGIKLSVLIVVLKKLVESLQAFPAMNASLDSETHTLILKQYYHIGVAVDTPGGLVVPVIRDVDQQSLLDLNAAVVSRAQEAREKGLPPKAMKGGSFTVSSLGGIGGTAFTPIVNAPEVAILGLSRASQQPIYVEGEWQPMLHLPLSLSYDHRVIDGAEGARFLMDLTQRLEALTREEVIELCQVEEKT